MHCFLLWTGYHATGDKKEGCSAREQNPRTRVTFNQRLIPPQCQSERFRKLLLSAAIRNFFFFNVDSTDEFVHMMVNVCVKLMLLCCCFEFVCVEAAAIILIS